MSGGVSPARSNAKYRSDAQRRQACVRPQTSRPQPSRPSRLRRDGRERVLLPWVRPRKWSPQSLTAGRRRCAWRQRRCAQAVTFGAAPSARRWRCGPAPQLPPAIHPPCPRSFRVRPAPSREPRPLRAAVSRGCAAGYSRGPCLPECARGFPAASSARPCAPAAPRPARPRAQRSAAPHPRHRRHAARRDLRCDLRCDLRYDLRSSSRLAVLHEIRGPTHRGPSRRGGFRRGRVTPAVPRRAGPATAAPPARDPERRRPGAHQRPQPLRRLCA